MVLRTGPLGNNEAYHLLNLQLTFSREMREEQTKLGRALCV